MVPFENTRRVYNLLDDLTVAPRVVLFQVRRLDGIRVVNSSRLRQAEGDSTGRVPVLDRVELTVGNIGRYLWDKIPLISKIAVFDILKFEGTLIRLAGGGIHDFSEVYKITRGKTNSEGEYYREYS